MHVFFSNWKYSQFVKKSSKYSLRCYLAATVWGQCIYQMYFYYTARLTIIMPRLEVHIRAVVFFILFNGWIVNMFDLIKRMIVQLTWRVWQYGYIWSVTYKQTSTFYILENRFTSSGSGMGKRQFVKKIWQIYEISNLMLLPKKV